MMTKTPASELAKSNIGANAVAPGAIETPMNILLDENEVARHKTLTQIPMEGSVGRKKWQMRRVFGFRQSKLYHW